MLGNEFNIFLYFLNSKECSECKNADKCTVCPANNNHRI